MSLSLLMTGKMNTTCFANGNYRVSILAMFKIFWDFENLKFSQYFLLQLLLTDSSIKRERYTLALYSATKLRKGLRKLYIDVM